MFDAIIAFILSLLNKTIVITQLSPFRFIKLLFSSVSEKLYILLFGVISFFEYASTVPKF